MKTLYESLLDDDLEKQSDEMIKWEQLFDPKYYTMVLKWIRHSNESVSKLSQIKRDDYVFVKDTDYLIIWGKDVMYDIRLFSKSLFSKSHHNKDLVEATKFTDQKTIQTVWSIAKDNSKICYKIDEHIKDDLIKAIEDYQGLHLYK